MSNNKIIREFREHDVSYYLIETPYGICKQRKSLFKIGSKLDIRAAIDKTEYFKNICLHKFGSSNDCLDEIEYKGNHNKIKIKCKVTSEFYWLTPAHYLNGKRSKKSFYIKLKNNRTSSKDYVFFKINSLHPELKIISDNYIRNNIPILIKDKYGICKVLPMNLLKGVKPTIKTAINKTQYFINQAREVHGDKYNYSLVNYKNNIIKIKINGPNGVFEQSPSIHLQGQGCPIEGRKKSTEHARENPSGWSFTNWEKAAKKSKHFTGYKVYFIKCWDEESNEVFYKIGKTFVDVVRRFKYKSNIPYKYKIIKTIESNNARKICILEKEYKNKNKNYKYIPNKKFGGMHECFLKLKNLK